MTVDRGTLGDIIDKFSTRCACFIDEKQDISPIKNSYPIRQQRKRLSNSVDFLYGWNIVIGNGHVGVMLSDQTVSHGHSFSVVVLTNSAASILPSHALSYFALKHTEDTKS